MKTGTTNDTAFIFRKQIMAVFMWRWSRVRLTLLKCRWRNGQESFPFHGGTVLYAPLSFLCDNPDVINVSICLDKTGLAGMETIHEAILADGELSRHIRNIVTGKKVKPEGSGKDTHYFDGKRRSDYEELVAQADNAGKI